MTPTSVTPRCCAISDACAAKSSTDWPGNRSIWTRGRSGVGRHYSGYVHRLAGNGLLGAGQSTPSQAVPNAANKQLILSRGLCPTWAVVNPTPMGQLRRDDAGTVAEFVEGSESPDQGRIVHRFIILGSTMVVVLVQCKEPKG